MYLPMALRWFLCRTNHRKRFGVASAKISHESRSGFCCITLRVVADADKNEWNVELGDIEISFNPDSWAG